MRSDLNRYLWRLGRGSARSSHAGWIRVVALAVASASVAIGALAFTFTLVAGQERATLMLSILPVQAEGQTDTALHYRSTIVSVTDQHGAPQGVLAVWIEPIRPDAPLPPGLERWPEPGEAVLSPQLLRDLRGHPPDLFGSVIGTIGLDGLESPTERRVYIRPRADAVNPTAMTAIRGFGFGGMPGLWGLPTLNALPMWMLVPLVGGLTLVPALFALGLASGIGKEARISRTRQLEAMGARRRTVAVLDMAEAWPSMVVGCIVVFVGAGLVGITGLRVEALDLWVPAARWRSWWPHAVVALVLSHLVAVAVVLMTRTMRRAWSRRRPRREQQKVPWVMAATCPVAVAFAILIPSWSHTATARTLGYHLPVLVVLLTLPALLASVLSRLGTRARRVGLRRGMPSAILGGRRLELLPMRTARLIGGLAGAILLLGQVQLNASTLSFQYQLASEARAEYGDVVMTASNTTYGESMGDFLDELPPTVASVWTTTTYDERSTLTSHTITGTCDALSALHLACQPSKNGPTDPSRQWMALAASVGIFQADAVHVVPVSALDLSALEAEGAQLNLVSIDGADLLVDELQKASYLFVGGLGLRSVGDEWLGAGVIASQRATWVITWGLAGILPLIAVAALVLAADALISARETAPLAALFDRRRWLVGVSAWRVWLPVSLAGIVAALAYLVLPMSVSERSASLAFYTPSITFAWVSALLCVVVGLGVALGSAQSIAVAARGWRPGQAEASDATDERS